MFGWLVALVGRPVLPLDTSSLGRLLGWLGRLCVE